MQYLVGKMIKEVKPLKLKGYDDEGYLKITFTDNSYVVIESYYEKEKTEKSFGEYQTKIKIHENIDLKYFDGIQ